jgi:hypothetical protein
MLDFLVEQKLSEAVSRGELDDLPGAGRPLELDDDALVPEDMRMTHRILRNAGYAPAEVRKPGLLRLRIEARYYGKVVRKLGRR